MLPAATRGEQDPPARPCMGFLGLHKMMAHVPSPGRGCCGQCWGPTPQGERELTQLFDAFLVLDEELYPRDVYVQSGALRGALHRRVKAAVILAVR